MKGQFSFTEEDLKAAVLIVRDALLDTMPIPSEIHYTLSDDFIKKMDMLCIVARKKVHIRTMLQKAAMFFLAILIALGTWLTFDTEARAVVIKWVHEVYENHVIYRFFGRESSEAIPDYSLTWIPENFELYDKQTSETKKVMYYYNDKTESIILFECHKAHEGFQTHYIDDYDVPEKITINGLPADYYPAINDSTTNSLIWIDEAKSLVFMVDADLPKSVILHIAEAVALCKTEN